MQTEVKISSKRLDSLDALRGFDMAFIMGIPAIIACLEQLFGGAALGWLSEQMHHAKWDGLRIMDLVFPTFLFIAGCSFPLSLIKRREKGQSNSQIYKHIFTRVFWMILLGCVYNGLLKFDFEHIRYASVLARIGIAWMFASLIYMHVSNRKLIVALPFITLAIYSLVIGNVYAPDAEAGLNIYTPEASIVGWVDRMLLPGRLLRSGLFDPEGILSTIPAISTALLGMLAGDILQNDKYNPNKKVCIFSLLGTSFIIAGVVLSIWEPINKALWSSSFTLVSAGISLLMLTLFYWIIDIKNIKKGFFFFKIIGMNSLVIYLGQQIISFKGISSYLFNGLASLFSENIGNLILSCGYVAVCWLFLYFLYKKNVFLKI